MSGKADCTGNRLERILLLKIGVTEAGKAQSNYDNRCFSRQIRKPYYLTFGHHRTIAFCTEPNHMHAPLRQLLFAAVLAFSGGLPHSCLAQQSWETDAVNLTKINFLNPGISYEHRIAKNQTLQFSAFMNVLISTVISSNYDHTDVYLDPAAELGYRYYFNFAKRIEREKRIDKNSGNYLSLYTQVIHSKMLIGAADLQEIKRRPVGVFGACWGFQRNYIRHFSLDLNLGLQYRIGKSTYPDMANTIRQETAGEFLPAAKLTLGFWLKGK